MTHFKNIQNLEDLKAQYRKLAFKHHPDMGGDIEVMKAVNNEYDIMFPIWQHTHNTTAAEKNTETAQQTRSEFYTQNGWKGKNYDMHLTTKDVTALIREYVKQAYPLYKFSITFSSFSGGSNISVSLMEAPHEVLNCPNDKTYIQINQYYIDQHDELTEQTKEVLIDINKFINSYRFSDCDGMIDYFNVSFWYDIHIGKWNKPFKKVEKTLRIQETKQTAAPEQKQIKSNNKYDIQEDVDTRDNSKIFVVKLPDKLDKDEYIKVSEFMKTIGGYYSRFKKGFLFRDNPAAKLTV